MRSQIEILDSLIKGMHRELAQLKDVNLNAFILAYTKSDNKITVALTTIDKWEKFRLEKAADISEKGIKDKIDYLFERLITRDLRKGEYGEVVEYMSEPAVIYGKATIHSFKDNTETIKQRLLSDHRMFVLRVFDWINFDDNRQNIN